MNGVLGGKHAVVTGGNRGIGRAVALELRKRGARVSVVSRSAVAQSPSESDGIFRVQADITREDEIAAALDACRAAHGPIAVLINNSGIAESAPLVRTGRAMWDLVIATNLTGTFLCTRSAVQDMLVAQWGRIVNVASIAGLFGSPYLSAYCASKHGVVGLTRVWAQEFADTGITANVVCPGYTETDMMQHAIATIVAKTGISAEAARAHLAQTNPGGRIVTTDEVARCIADLCEGTETGREIVIPQP